MENVLLKSYVWVGIQQKDELENEFVQDFKLIEQGFGVRIKLRRVQEVNVDLYFWEEGYKEGYF